MAVRSLKEQLNSDDIVVAPGIYDMISALVADRMGFQALYVTGYGTVASHLGLPDAGIATYSDMVSRIATMAKMTSTPLIADADTGYGGLLNVHHTVRGYEEAGVSAVQLEDQEFPKKCGHTPGRRVIPFEDMVQKIKIACDARRSDDLLIIARTDSRTALGLDEALNRAQAYSDAGADVIFVESPESEQEMETIGKCINKPLVANMVPGGRTPLLSAEKLQSLGFSLAIHPAAGFLATAAALEKSYTDLKDNGGVTDSSLLYSFSEFNELIGFPGVWEFEKRYMS
ncbi:isocitrate lyase/PEP mutase family protein [Billgrantia endophytica]|uniref:Carboxyvinyl-carboxyphosphonate phosphorylmutase n=1 Tax=Billgrantia endophytica TaxID=2033802 RepID=A0A2N7TZI1_9GAMM|nr:isocitrate lyase/PEP mutase family protein [Halomonas endophytica]PMR73582.1 carboxyvinyl-carboxyphosphonate phosphorylmutase [Halomonas endophytica]